MPMKISNYFQLASTTLSLLALSAQGQTFDMMGFGRSTSHIVLVIKSDGSCVLTSETDTPRRSLEMQLRSWEEYKKRSEGGDSEELVTDAAPPTTTKSERKPLSDEQLAVKIRELYQQREASDEELAAELQRVEVSTNQVHLVTRRSYASIRELLSQSPYTWGPNVLMFEDARFELDTNRNLRVTLTASQGSARYFKTTSRAWKSSGMNYEWKLVLPGKIQTSGLPNTEGNATWISLDAGKPETLDAAVKLLGTPLVIAAEPGGIQLPEPLESKKLVLAAYKQRKAGPDLPITDAAPGFLAEPVSISLSTVYHFPEAEKYAKDRPEASMFGLSPTGTVVSAKLFPPKGRQIKSVSGLRVKEAKDDKGRAIPGIAETSGEEEDDSEGFSYATGDSDNAGATRIELRLGLPAPDAKAINELTAEAVALTIGSWKEMVLTNVQADAKKEIDLSEVLPGAKMIIKKIGAKNPQRTVEAILQGPKTVSELDLKIKLSNRRNGQSNMQEVRTRTSGETTSRTVTLRAYEFQAGNETSEEPLTLVVRFPQDVKRERVQFKLTALDLL